MLIAPVPVHIYNVYLTNKCYFLSYTPDVACNVWNGDYYTTWNFMIYISLVVLLW